MGRVRRAGRRMATNAVSMPAARQRGHELGLTRSNSLERKSRQVDDAGSNRGPIADELERERGAAHPLGDGPLDARERGEQATHRRAPVWTIPTTPPRERWRRSG